MVIGGARRRRRPHGALLAMTLPAALLLGLFFLLPTAWALYTSTTDLTLIDAGAGTPDFVGFDNLRRMLDDPDFGKIVRNTVVFVVGSAIIGQTLLGLLLALLLHHAESQGRRLTGTAYLAVLLAWITPPTLTGYLWGGVFNYRDGLLNSLLTGVGFGRTDLVGEQPMLAVIIADAWRGVGFAMLLFLGALQSVPPDVLAAARVDGAGAWRRLRDHTLPLIGRVAAIVLVITTIGATGSFLVILTLTNGDPAYQTETLALYAYHQAFTQFDLGFGAAIGVVILLINAAFALVYLPLGRAAR